MEKLIGYTFISDDEVVKENSNEKVLSVVLDLHDLWPRDNSAKSTTFQEKNFVEVVAENSLEDFDDFENEDMNLELYDNELTFEENFEDGSDVKYIPLPIYKNNTDENTDYTRLLYAGGKVIMNRKKIMDDYSEGFNYIVVDYDSIHGLRLRSFQRFESTMFSCEERVFFETLLIKFKSFHYKAFFYSLSEIQREVGIKKDKAKSIVKKFVDMGFLKTDLRKSKVNGKPCQITYYEIDAKKVIELVPQIYAESYHEFVTEQLTEYFKPILKAKEKQVNNSSGIVDITRVMQ